MHDCVLYLCVCVYVCAYLHAFIGACTHIVFLHELVYLSVCIFILFALMDARQQKLQLCCISVQGHAVLVNLSIVSTWVQRKPCKFKFSVS